MKCPHRNVAWCSIWAKVISGDAECRQCSFMNNNNNYPKGKEKSNDQDNRKETR